MDTILYIYKKRGLSEPRIEPVGMKTYLLIRIALDVNAEEWFGIKLRHSPEAVQTARAVKGTQVFQTARAVQTSQAVQATQMAQTSQAVQASQMVQTSQAVQASQMVQMGGAAAAPLARRSVSGPFGWLGRRRERRRERIRRRQEEQERAAFWVEREEQISRVTADLERLAAQVREMAEDSRACFCVYEDSVRKNLTERPPVWTSGADFPGEGAEPRETDSPNLPSLWQDHFPWGEFRGYFGQFWVEKLFSEAVHPHFVILGSAPCLFLLLEQYARKMKSVRWLISEGDFSREISEFAEDFYTEYGLAVGLEILGSPASLRRVRLSCSVPVNILDFTGETRPDLSEVAGGSIWLDMLSVEEKGRRIAMRGSGITYVSLKEMWKTAQKRCGCPIFP